MFHLRQELLKELSVSSSSEDDDDRPSQRHCMSSQLEESDDVEKNVTASTESSTTKAIAKKISISDRTCSQCQPREPHELNMHSKKALLSSSDTIPPSFVSSPVYSVVTRGQRGKQKAVEYPRIFNYQKNAVKTAVSGFLNRTGDTQPNI